MNYEKYLIGKQIRDIEITTRNISAHNLVSITASWVKKYSGYTPEEIYGFLKNYVKKKLMIIHEFSSAPSAIYIIIICKYRKKTTQN